MKEDYQKTFKKSILFFLSNPVLFNGHNYEKQEGPGTSNQLHIRLQNKFRKSHLLVMYDLNKFDYVIWSSLFLSYSKNSSADLYKPIHGIINYFTFICPSESGKCVKEGKKWQKFEYLKNEKSFLDEMKSIFHSF